MIRLNMSLGEIAHTAVHFLAGARRVAPIRVTDEGEALGPLGFSVPGKENSGDTTESFEEIPQLLFLCKLADLFTEKKKVSFEQINPKRPRIARRIP